MSIGIVGLGYVGLPLAVAFAEAGERSLTLPSAEREASHISARTLLPLARHIATSLAASAVEVPHADRSPSVAEPAAPGVAAAVPAAAELAGRDASASRPTSCRPAAAAAIEPPYDGELSC